MLSRRKPRPPRSPPSLTAPPSATTTKTYTKPVIARHLIENFFAKLKQYRALATRYDKLKVNFLGAIYLAATVIWLN
jgi:transposase